MAFKMKKNKPGSLYKKAVYKNSNVYKLRTENEEDMIKVSIPSVDIEGGEGGRYTTSYDFPYFYNKPVKKTHSDGSLTMSDGTYVSAQNVEKFGGVKYYGNKQGKGRYTTSPGMTITRKRTPEGDGSGEVVQTTKDGVVGSSTRRTGQN